MKNGYSILELLIALAIASIVTALVSNLYLKYNNIYNENTKYNRDYFYSTEALMFIQNEIIKAQSIAINNNVIVVNYPDGKIKKNIMYNGSGSIVIIHFENGVRKNTDNILNNVREFSVIQKNSTIYVSVSLNGGEKYERCFGIKLE